ncbi:MAG: DUF1850 domain-containing protein [Synergistaceae bacterium]|jgi:hypothetical protein|nr:DUF1850 domain-containing protein [Synergistaceae bacterium]
MSINTASGRGGRHYVLFARSISAILTALLVFIAHVPLSADSKIYLRVSDWSTGAIFAEAPVQAGDKLFFGWIHSLERIPWNEYYHIDENLSIILDAITFPAFGAGIPENKGKVCYVKDGLIHMEQIDQKFNELVWLNSHTATQEIRLNDKYITRGSELPQHRRVRLTIERSCKNDK